MARLSALTATEMTVALAAGSSLSSRTASAVSACIWRAILSRVWPEDVGRTGLERFSRTCPTDVSRALMRWLTAEGVMWRRRAAASKVPSATHALSASS